MIENENGNIDNNLYDNISNKTQSELFNQNATVNSIPVIDIEDNNTNIFGINLENNVEKNDDSSIDLKNDELKENDANDLKITEFQNEHVDEAPKYGAISNEKANLNADENSGIKFIIILAIIMLLFIILLPYLSKII